MNREQKYFVISVVNAIQWDGTNLAAIGEFTGQTMPEISPDGSISILYDGEQQNAQIGDYVIRGVTGYYFVRTQKEFKLQYYLAG